MGCSSSAQQGSRDSVPSRNYEYEKDKSQEACEKPAASGQRAPDQKASVAQNNLEVKSAKTTEGSSVGQITNQNSASTTVTPTRKSTGPNVLPKLPNITENGKSLLYGRIHSLSVSCDKPDVIQFYHCAVAEDSCKERTQLFQSAYSKLGQKCAESGFNLKVTDLNWRSSFNLQQQVSGMCLKEIQCCQDSACKVFFVIFLNDKYGSTCPLSFASSDMDGLLSSLSSEDSEMVGQFYKQDLNCSPPSYVLQTPAEAGVAEDDWQENMDKLMKILQQGLSQEMRNQYLLSDFDRTITEGILNQGIPATNIILITRQFTGVPDDVDDAWLKCHKNFICQEVDIVSDELTNLKSKLKMKTVGDNVLEFETPWNDSGVDESYLASLDERFFEVASKHIADAVEEKKAQNNNLCGISSVLYRELSQQLSFCQSVNQSFQGRSDVLAKLNQYLLTGHVTKTEDLSTRHPLILHGESGSGKSAICGVLAKTWQAVQGWEMGVCCARFVGASSLPKTMLATLHSICQQIDSAYSLSLTQFCKNGKQLYTAIKETISSQPPQHPLLVMIDGFDQLVDGDVESLSWLPRDLPPNVRVIISSSKLDVFKNIVTDNDYYLSVRPLNVDECSAILGHALTSHNRTLTSEQKESIVNDLTTQGLALYACTAADIARKLSSFSVDNLSCDSIQELVCQLLDKLESIHGKEIVSCILTYLCITCNGLSDTEILDLLFCDNRVSDSCKEQQLPRKSWPVLRGQLTGLVICLTSQAASVYVLANRAVKDIVEQRYAVKLLGSREILLKYFSGQLGSCCVMESRRHCLELPLMLSLAQIGNAKSLLFDIDWLSRKLVSAGVFSLLCDVYQLRLQDSTCKDLELLQTLLTSSSLCLLSHPSHLPLKLKTLLEPQLQSQDCPLLKGLCNDLQGTYLLPSAEILAETCGLRSGDDIKKSVIMGIFRIPSCPNHVVSVATDKGEVSVWDVKSQKLMRCLSGVALPRNVKMVDADKAVVLCNRELKVYNLNEGTMQAKMKGVLNVKMPYFGIHDADHVVALSRNRMYVNIMNMHTGDMAATFKVGEDRFLNSLVVSQNGNMCVCGDEVQKPFPLLVWDLPNRKLVHDFRIAGHEFWTAMSAITNDGHYFVCVCKELDEPAPNFLIVYDLQSGQLFKKWKPESNTTAVAISSESNLVVSACEDMSVIVWDMVAGSARHELHGHSVPVDTIKFSDDGLRCVTYNSLGKDMAIFLWDLSSGQCLGTYSPDDPVTCCEISADGSMVFVALPGNDVMVTLKPCALGSEWRLEGAMCYGNESLQGQTLDLSQAG